MGDYVEVRTWDGRVVRVLPAPCTHPSPVDVESVAGEVVARLCTRCDTQLLC